MKAPIQIRRPEVVDDARTLAEITGDSITNAVARAVRNQLAIERQKAQESRARREAKAREHLAAIWALPVVGPTLTDDDLYDEDGLPKSVDLG